jgi:hypothetical protein
MSGSRLERLLESTSRERRLAGSPYLVSLAKDERLGFKRREHRNSHADIISFVSSPRRPLSLSEQEWRSMEDEINAANFVLNIENELEADDFVPYTRETLSRATGFLQRLMIHAHSANLVGVGVPRIGPADRGSIDLYWEKSDRTLLINFPASGSVANYYGKKPKSEISGRFDPSEARAELALWLAD